VRRAVAVLTVAWSLTGPGAARAEELASAIAPFVGAYRYSGGKAELAALDAAIDEVVGKMNVMVRWIARRKVRAPNLPSDEIILSLEGALLKVARPGHPTVAAPADGTPVAWTSPEGDSFQVRHGIERDVLYQRFEGRQSVSVNHLRLSPDARSLVVETRVEARRLPAPLVFRFTYLRR
jgi:hypothetical protein